MAVLLFQSSLSEGCAFRKGRESFGSFGEWARKWAKDREEIGIHHHVQDLLLRPKIRLVSFPFVTDSMVVMFVVMPDVLIQYTVLM